MTKEPEHRGGLGVRDSTGKLPADDLVWLCAMGDRALGLLRAAGEVRVRVIDDARMSEAHGRFSGIAGTTDVLTFDERTDPAAPLDADLLVCLDEAQRQAALRGHAVREELLLYIIHGILHCLGHDDHDEDARANMHAREDSILTALGIGAVYAREPRA